MIEYSEITVDNWRTEGFDAALSGDTLSFTGGSVELPTTTYNYEAFEFDFEGDADIPVQYDVYLLGNNEVDVIRTELGVDTLVFYDGEEALIHCLISIVIPPGDSPQNLTLQVRKVAKLPPQEETTE